MVVVGAQIGAYRLVKQIGEGGMGAVWLAEHMTLGRRAAVKLLHPSFSYSQEIVNRFFNEARAATAISDPGIVQIFDFGHTPEGQAYIVMELLEGEPLDHRLYRLGHLPVPDALRIIRQVAGSLGAAHARNIIHRDLKPENIYLVRDPEVVSGERAKLLDFGIAKLGDQAGVKTQTNAVMGTPVYMSPEQCRGAGKVDARSDIYSLGCVLFTLIAGRPPFTSDGAELGPGELIVKHITAPAPRITDVMPHVQPSIAALIARCLEKAPEARFANGSELAQALGMLISSVSATVHASVPAHQAPTTVPQRTTTLAGAAAQAGGTLPPAAGNRGKGLWIGLAAVVVAGGVGAVVVTNGGRSDTRPSSPPVATPALLPAPAPTPSATSTPSPPGAPASAPPTAPTPAPSTAPTPAPDIAATPAPAAAPTPAPTPPPMPAPPPARAPAQARVSISIMTTPAGAQVFVDSEKKPRGSTPYVLALDHDGGPIEVRLVLAGYVTQKRNIERTADAKLAVVLDKIRTPAATTNGSNSNPDDADETMDPFHKKH